jgi:hypothetical protein
MMRKGKGLEFPEGWGGGKGSRIHEADSDDRGFPLLLTKNCYNFMDFRWIMLIKNA